MRKSAAVLGSTVTAISVATPLLPSVEVEAAENESQQSTVYSSTNSNAYIEQLAGHAQTIAGPNNLYASVMIAQAVIESGWGQSGLSQSPYHNLFGIKGSYNGETVYMNTQEYLNGQWVTMKEPFKKYPSFSESFQDNANTLKNVSLQPGVYYYSGAWKSNTSSYRDATAWLTGRYATAPNYASALNNVIESYNLTRYDTPASGNTTNEATNTNTSTQNKPSTPPTPSTPSKPTANGQNYTVQSGDSVWLIADRYGMTMDELCSLNGIQNNFIYPGQKLIVSKGDATSTNKPSQPTTQQNKPSIPSTPTTNNGATYTVQSGDSVWLVANKYSMTMDELCSLNGIQNNFIYPGQTLKVKGDAASANKPSQPSTPNKPSTPSTNTGATYTVQSGDSVWFIADKYGMTMDELCRLNGIQDNFIYPGQTLKVKGDAASANKPSQPSTPSTPNANSGSQTTYTVKSGDSVWFVANKFGLTMDELSSLNGIQNNFIYPGQTLVVAKGGSANTSTPSQQTTPSTPTTQAPNTGSQATYTVQSGDSVWLIADRYGMTMDELCSLNGIQNNFIYPGQKLIVSKGDATSTNKPSQPTTQQNKPSIPSTPTTNNGATYTVQSGDSVWLVANKYSMTMDELCSLNGIQNNFIYPGQTLKVKGDAASANKPSQPSTPNKPSTPSTNTGATYTVQSGDSVWFIADKYGMTMDELCRLNGIQDNFIYPGQTLKVKGDAASANKPSQPSTPSTPNANSGSQTTYTVKSGDSVWFVANKFGLTMDELSSLNGIQNNFIYPGQTLVVAKGGSANTSTPSQQTTPSTPTTQAPNTGSQATYTVQSGDSVWLVADKYGMTMDELCSWNGIQNNFIYPGQSLVVKGNSTSANKPSQPSQSTTPTTPEPSAPQANSNTGSYTVQSGDSVWLIADKFGLTIDELCSLNGIQNNFIYPGQSLIVKGNSTAANQSNQSITPSTPTTNVSTNNNADNANVTTYTVKSGDSVWLVSDKFGISIDELCSWNNIENNFIYPGLTLKVA
ncbi:hypothetical protein RV16_GL002286 [Enterococcus saccharolyticus]|nr:hypothetical protein RV16_GL002286 [Enterococcus saccharolyticus]